MRCGISLSRQPNGADGEPHDRIAIPISHPGEQVQCLVAMRALVLVVIQVELTHGAPHDRLAVPVAGAIGRGEVAEAPCGRRLHRRNPGPPLGFEPVARSASTPSEYRASASSGTENTPKKRVGMRSAASTAGARWPRWPPALAARARDRPVRPVRASVHSVQSGRWVSFASDPDRERQPVTGARDCRRHRGAAKTRASPTMLDSSRAASSPDSTSTTSDRAPSRSGMRTRLVISTAPRPAPGRSGRTCAARSAAPRAMVRSEIPGARNSSASTSKGLRGDSVVPPRSRYRCPSGNSARHIVRHPRGERRFADPGRPGQRDHDRPSRSAGLGKEAAEGADEIVATGEAGKVER